MNTKFGLKRLLENAVLAGVLAVFAATAGAAALDSRGTKSLLSDHTWQIKFITTGTVVYWTWRSDGSVCPRSNTIDSECIDKGAWRLDGDRVCYQLTWLGATAGFKAQCFRVVDRGQGHYEASLDSGLPFWEFSVAK